MKRFLASLLALALAFALAACSNGGGGGGPSVNAANTDEHGRQDNVQVACIDFYVPDAMPSKRHP